MNCKQCHKTNIELTRESNDGNQGYWHREEYTCQDCGCEFQETTTTEITKDGSEDNEPN